MVGCQCNHSSMGSFKIDARNTPMWCRRNILDFLREFIFKEQLEQVEKHISRLEDTDPVWQGDNVCHVIHQVMHKCEGALDVYGSPIHLTRDLEAFWEFSHEKNYMQTSKMMNFIPKQDSVVSIANSVFPDHAFEQSSILVCKPVFDLLIDSISAQVERQLAGTYEIIHYRWVETVKFALSNRMRDTNVVRDVLKNTDTNESEWKNDIPTIFSVFSQLFNEEYDQHLLDSLRRQISWYFNSSSDSKDQKFYCLFLSYKQIHGIRSFIMSIINDHPYVFLPFSKTNRIKKTLVEPPVIRIIKLDVEQLMFSKEVQNAINRVLKDADQENNVLKELLRVESNEERDNGEYFMITQSEYLAILEQLHLNPDKIMLVEQRLVQYPHLPAVAISPYGTKCKPAGEVLQELLGVLTIGLRVWERIRPEKLKEVESKIEEVCAMFMDTTKPRYFIECGRVKRLEEHLRNSVKPLIENTPVPPNNALVPMSLTETFTVDLIRGSAKELRLTRLYPEISKYFPSASDKSIQIFGDDFIRTIELHLVVQSSLARCLAEKIPRIGRFICGQKSCSLFGLYGCPCSKSSSKLSSEDFRSYTPAIFTDENDYEMKFDYFADESLCHGSLIKKKGKQQLVTNLMAASFIANRFINQLERKHQNCVARHFAKILTSHSWVHNGTRLFYLTTVELNHLFEDVMRRFNTYCTSDDFKNSKRMAISAIGSKGDEMVTVMILKVSDECFNFALNPLKNIILFEQYMPNRIVYMTMRRFYIPQNDREELCANSGELLCFLKEYMLKNKMVQTRKIWDYFHRMLVELKTEGGWGGLCAELAISILNRFPVNPGKFVFVPHPDMVFRNFTREVSRVIALENKRNSKIEKDVSGMQGIIDAVQRMGSDLAKQTQELRVANTKIHSYENGKSEEVLTMKNKLEQAEKTFEKKLKEQEEQLKSVQRNLVELKNEAKQNIEKKDRQLKAQEASMKSTASKYEIEMKRMNAVLKSRDVEVETLKNEIASRPKYNQEIEKLEARIRQLTVDKEVQIKRLTDNHNSLCQSIRTDLARRTGETVILKRQLEEKVARIAELEEQTAGGAGALSSQRVDQLTGENQCLQSKLRLEQIKHDAVQRQNADLLKHIEEIEAILVNRSSASPAPLVTLPQEGPSTSGTSPSTSSSIPTSSDPSARLAVRVAPNTLECGICFNEMRRNGRTTKCNVCKTQWHSACINKWTLTNPTCPICRRSFPNPRQFPPLHRN